MKGKEYLDEKYGTPRGNGYGIAGILDEFGELKIQEEIVPKLKEIKECVSIHEREVHKIVQELIDKYDRG